MFLVTFHRHFSTHCLILETILTNLWVLIELFCSPVAYSRTRYAPNQSLTSSGKASFFDSCLLTLQDWFFSLPRELRIRPSDRSDLLCSSPHVFILHMVYHTSLILLVKPFIPLSLFQSPVKAQPKDPIESSQDIQSRALITCREAAANICYIGDLYRKRFGSCRRSPLTATHCTLMACLVNLHLSDQDVGGTSQATAGLKSCMLTLRELSDAWTPPRRYWENLTRTAANIQHAGKSARETTNHPSKAALLGKRGNEPRPLSIVDSMIASSPAPESLVSDNSIGNDQVGDPFSDAAWSFDDMESSVDFGNLDFSMLSSLPWDYALESSGMDFW